MEKVSFSINWKSVSIVVICIITIFIISIFMNNNEETIEINIGYQSVTSQTWGALVVKNLGLYEKKLQEIYPDKKIKVVWHDEISGSVINTSMISDKIDIGFMGDMPLLLNMYKADTIEDYNASLIALDGTGENGKNQAIVVSQESSINAISDLKGKTVSAPIGSSAHFMLMKILEKYDLIDDVEVVHQDVSMAVQLLSTNKTDAFAIWAPYPNYLSKEIGTKVIADGSESEVDYLAGVVINNKLKEKDEKLVEAFVEALNEAHEYIINNKEEAAKIMAQESGFSYDVALEEINAIEWDANIEEKDVETLKEKLEFLVSLDQIKEFDIEKYICN